MVLKYGSRGPQVQLLQLALDRAGFSPGELDGSFGQKTQNAIKKFQQSQGLTADGIVGRKTNSALRPWYSGYKVHTIRAGDTIYKLSLRYDTTVKAIETANPAANALDLRPGTDLIIPLSFNVVPTNIDYSSALISYCCNGLAARYPFITLDEMGKSVMGRPLYTLTLGSGSNRVFYNASHHANEWITTPLLLHFIEELAHAAVFEGSIYNIPAAKLLQSSTLCVAPAVNPDGIDLVTGALISGAYYERAISIAEDYPEIPFPSGWKANILGTDLNLQYPAGWSLAKEIKFAQGFISPAPRDYVGSAPLSAQESRSVYDFSLTYSPALTLSYHTQGTTIYWKYLNYEPTRSKAIALEFGRISGYAVEETPYASGFAGYKDWFIQNFDRPGYTIEAGSGTSPLPLTDFESIYNANVGILSYGMIATADI